MAGEAIRFNASLNTAGFDSGAKNLQNLAANASAGITRHFGKIAAAVVGIGAAFIGVRAAVQAFNAAVAMGGQLNDLSARTGETAGNLAILQRAFENAGAGAESVGPTINRLQRAIVEAGEGGKEQAEAFGKLGLNLERLKGLTPTEQLQAVAGALQGVGNDSDRSAIAMQLLGRSGGELLPLLRAMGSELDVARQQLGSLPDVIDKTNGHLDRIGDNFAAIGEKGKEFMVGLLERLGPALADLTDRLANIDAAGFGAKLSEYAEATVRWVAETFKLGEALNQIETAIKGIASGNFGDGLKLMFLTARDTALNAINKIVAAASAAVQTVGASVSQMFRSGGPLISLITSGFQIAANYLREALYGALADFMGAIGRMGMADKFRYEAETAARSIEMLAKGIGAQVDLVGEDAKEIFASIPQEFQKSYEANMQEPLFDMTKRATETANQMERVAAATLAAAFSAEEFGQALRDAQVDKLAGLSESGSEMGVNENNRKFPWQGAGPSGPQNASDRVNAEMSDARSRNAPSGGGPSPEPTRNERIGEMRGAGRSRTAEERAAALEQAGMYSSADAARQRARQQREQEMQKALMKDHYADLGFNNFREAYDKYREDTRMGDRMSEEEFKKFQEYLANQSKSPEERREDEKGGSGKGGGGGGKSELETMINNVFALLKTHIPSIDEKLPQHALS
jgi:hypothetical protein